MTLHHRDGECIIETEGSDVVIRLAASAADALADVLERYHNDRGWQDMSMALYAAADEVGK